MLRELRIENLLLIERAELRLGPGLNVLTGETGAGKTVLAHSLDLLMGGKAKKGIVRSGAPEAWVEGVFDLPPEWHGDEELADLLDRIPAGSEEVVLGRRVSESGRTSAFVGGRSASAADLQLLATRLIAFYGQHEHRRLTIGSAQLAMVDRAAGLKQQERLNEYGSLWRRRRELARELDELLGRDMARERDLDLLRFELDEIEAASLIEGEKEVLTEERDRLRHAEGLREAAAGAGGRIRGGEDGEGAVGLLAGATDALAALKGVDADLDSLAGRVESLALEMEDVGLELGRYLERVEADPERLAELEERLDLIDRLGRKHGGTIESVLAHGAWCREEIERLEGGESKEAALRSELEAAKASLDQAAKGLGRARRKAAGELAAEVTADLEDLAMPGAVLSIDLPPVADGPGPSGGESAEFMLAPNPGLPAQPLRDTASGGELSRVMLALAASGAGDRRTLVFDEIDAGIGGNTAAAVGERLRQVADGRQVIAITHLPQVASRAAAHFTVEKSTGAGSVCATVTALDEDAVVTEITRMLGAGEGDEAAARHARELVMANR
ncbi:MAG TPA: DNA repair protein RecN [Solirubrobacterales bacterium]|nr:DNA repair protein RecN [Solirubrobacterales bacterium]HNC14295.1 DNA repair protein RecN [Solirubrobacterales bacterium]HNE78357.1 DNA repair protein RecN [Solirubrobacterales bacterium]HNG56398.1 DNA repair protein RecN [Solirubrobacterales bacterium]HNI39765.1 DNA repair protein RecN [Solirubrobacterales bacterium]